MSPQGQHIQAEPSDIESVPARVRQAMEIIRIFYFKECARPLFGEHGGSVDGQPLQVCEEETRSAACNCLISYFGGNLTPDAWDEARVKKLTSDKDAKDSGMVITCLSCGKVTAPNPSCHLCGGSGFLLVTPVHDPRAVQQTTNQEPTS